jgi:TRAP-type C4-dicarboxylate transport system permease small subunit
MLITKKQVFSFIFLFIFSVIQIISIISFASPARADESLFNSQTGMNEIGGVYGNNKTDVRIIIVRIIQIALAFVALIFVVLIIYAGFRYMTAAGNQDQAKKALAQIKDAVMGLFIVIAAWALATFIIVVLGRAVAGKVKLF